MNRPFTVINAAISADGKLSTRERKQVRISGNQDFERVDKLRASADAVMVGIGTIRADDPSLTVKSEELRNSRKARGLNENPARIVIDSKARTSLDADIFRKGEGLRIIVVSNAAPLEKVQLLRKKATVIITGKNKVNLVAMMTVLQKMGINNLMVEGGATLNWGLVSNNLVDEIYTFVGNMLIGGSNAPSLIGGDGFSDTQLPELELLGSEVIDDGVLLRWKVNVL